MSPVLSRRGLLGGTTAALGAIGIPISAEAGISAASDDADFVDLIRRHAKAEEVCRRAEAAAEETSVAFLAAEPARPEALRWRPGDFPRTPLGSGLSDPGEGEERWYGVRALGWLRDRPAETWFVTLTPPLGPECEARRVEILDAWDAHQAARQAVAVSTGYTTATEAVDTAADLVVNLACEVKRARPRSLCGLRALAEWFGRQAEEGAAHDDALALFAATVAAFGGMS